jgi:cytochrome c peroxidase
LQKQGLELFRGTYNCTSCHQTALFNKQGTPNEGNGYNSSGEFGTDPSLSSFVDTTFITNEALQAKFKALPNPDNRLALSMAESATNIAPVSLSQANIGLDANPVDAGFAGVTNNNKDMGKMKIPDLRNVMHTGPYMHDGRFKTIDEVLNHYSHGIANNSSLDGRLQDAYGNAAKLNISEIDKLALKAFLTTLTDNSILHNPDFADPFVYE